MITKPRYYLEAERLLGLKEIPGKQANEDIVQLWADAGIPQVKDDETPWCAAFVNGCLVRGNKYSTKSGLARSFLFDEHKDKFEKLDGPELYSVGVMKRGNSSWQGHVGFVADFNDKYVWLLGGNQNNGANITRYSRSAFSGPGLGFVKPKLKSLDVTDKQLAKDSRALRVGGWYEKVILALAAAGTATYNFVLDFKQFVSDNTGVVVLGALALGLLGLKTYEFFTKNAYAEGRYLPKEHE